MRAFVWVGLGILALNVLFVGALALASLIRRVSIARTRRELERLGFVVRLPLPRGTRPMWPRVIAGFAGFAALIITTSAITAAPSTRTEASTAGSSFQGAPSHETDVHTGTNTSSEQPGSQDPTASGDVPGPRPSTTSSTSPPTDAGGNAGNDAGSPSTVAAVPTSATSIRLEWAPVDNAGRYRIDRSIDATAWKPVGSTNGETAYNDLALTSGTTYYYRITAFVDGQDASPSDAVSATTTVDTSTPPVFISAMGSVASIELEWNDVGGALGFRIERSPDGTTGWTGIGTTGEDVTSYTDTGLASATSYSYRIVALTPDGDSPPSTVKSATTDPEAPTTSQAQGGSASSDPNAAPDPKDSTGSGP